MFNPSLAAPPTLKFSAVVEVLQNHDPDLGVRCRLFHKDGWYDAWTWHSLDTAYTSPLRRGIATTLEMGQNPEDVVLLGFTEELKPLISTVLPDALCPIEGVVRQTTALIDGLQIAPLRDFVARALLRRDVLHGYWTSPASRRDHHAYPGGLAHHSLEVATMMASAAGLLDVDRELGIAFALLHDYGKIWCYGPRNPAVVPSREHEAYGLAQLEENLDVLTWEEPTLGSQMRELLGGPRAARTGSYPLAIGKIVRSFDQMSCEMTRKSGTAASSLSTWDVPF